MQNNKFNTRDALKVCQEKLGITFRHGKESNGWFEFAGHKIARVTIPHGRKPIPPKTYCSIARQLKISTDNLDKLLECPLSYEDYVCLLALKNLLPA